MRLLISFIILTTVLQICACDKAGPEPIDMPDPTDSIDMDTMPVDSIPPDTAWKAWARELEGKYIGVCYHFSYSSFSPSQYDTTYNDTIVIGRFDHISYSGNLYYQLVEETEYTFLIPEAEFQQDSVYMFTLGASQVYAKTKIFKRSMKSLFSEYAVSYSNGGSRTSCNCFKQE